MSSVKDASGARDRETQLLLEVAEGNASSMRELYRSFERPLYALGVRWYGDRSLAEELVQEVTLRVWRKAKTFDARKGNGSSWIFAIARNAATDLARAKNRQPIPSSDLPEIDRTPWDDEAAWHAWEVTKAVRTLPPEQQKVIELAYVHQYTYAEIADTLGIPIGTAKTRLHRGLAKLARILVDTGAMEPSL